MNKLLMNLSTLQLKLSFHFLSNLKLSWEELSYISSSISTGLFRMNIFFVLNPRNFYSDANEINISVIYKFTI